MTRDTRRAGAFLVALGSAVTLLALLAGPAGAQTTTTTVFPTNIPAGSTAIDNSVSSGTAYAAHNSTASGDAVAVDNSTASGCADAAHNSTASGDDTCGVTRTPTTPTTVRPSTPGGGGGATSTGGGTGGGAATASSARLALTGSWSGPMLAIAALAMALGAWLLVVASDRRRAFRA